MDRIIKVNIRKKDGCCFSVPQSSISLAGDVIDAGGKLVITTCIDDSAILIPLMKNDDDDENGNERDFVRLKLRVT